MRYRSVVFLLMASMAAAVATGCSQDKPTASRAETVKTGSASSRSAEKEAAGRGGGDISLGGPSKEEAAKGEKQASPSVESAGETAQKAQSSEVAAATDPSDRETVVVKAGADVVGRDASGEESARGREPESLEVELPAADEPPVDSGALVGGEQGERVEREGRGVQGEQEERVERENDERAAEDRTHKAIEGCVPCSAEAVPNADVVVALGVQPDGLLTPSAGMMSNLVTAVALLQEGKAQKLMVCGGYTRGHIAEAEMMAIIAQALGVPLAKIVVENGSVDTEDNALNAAMLAHTMGFRSAILVAQKGHYERAAKLFRRASAFETLHAVVGLDLEPDFPKASLADHGAKGRFDAIVVHGVTTTVDFKQSALLVEPSLVELLSAASGLHHTYGAPLILWHPIVSHGHITRTEMMGIILASMGVPEQSMRLGSARRYERSGLDVAKMCRAAKASRIIALLPPDSHFGEARASGRLTPRALGGPGTADEAQAAYQKAGIEAFPVFVDPTGP